MIVVRSVSYVTLFIVGLRNKAETFGFYSASVSLISKYRILVWMKSVSIAMSDFNKSPNMTQLCVISGLLLAGLFR